MELTLHIPDDVAQRLSAAGSDLSRRALEAFCLEEYKAGRLTEAQLRAHADLTFFIVIPHSAASGGVMREATTKVKSGTL